MVTAVWQDCEFCGKFTFTFRKKFYLSRKNSVTKFATSPSGGTLCTSRAKIGLNQTIMIFSVENFITGLIWHEMGHLCIDLLKIEHNENYQITGFIFKYDAATKDWSCSVTCQSPQVLGNSDLIKPENNIELCFAILGQFAGSLFESVYTHKISGQNLSAISILQTGSGRNDASCFKNLIAEIQNDIKKNDLKKRICDSILKIFFDTILSNENFVCSLENIAKRYYDKIFETFDDKMDFLYRFEESEIETLSSEMNQILNVSGLKIELLKIRDELSTILKEK